jgi:cytochrome P450
MARTEARIAIEALFDRFHHFALDINRSDAYYVGWAFRSPKAVPVRFRAGT